MSGKNKTPGVLPKPKPKATATSTNMRTGATRGAGDDKEYMRKAAAANMEGGGEAKKTLEITQDIIKAGPELQTRKSGNRIKPQRPIQIYPSPEQKKKMEDIEFIRDGIRDDSRN